AATSVHVGDLDGSKRLRGKSKWQVSITVTVHDNVENLVPGASVTGQWSGAHSGTVTGSTSADGTVTFSTGSLSGGNSVTFEVTAVAHDLEYAAGANHDPDGDSNGTSVTVLR
ncbi:MAG TPA: hypothetical protein VK992_00870, partial [Candidatus Caenarcaniphilales bacterium]|nr:hypothetical protein [Candidatus Caenarcaniphilales bacterium]